MVNGQREWSTWNIIAAQDTGVRGKTKTNTMSGSPTPKQEQETVLKKAPSSVEGSTRMAQTQWSVADKVGRNVLKLIF